jgi:hypothetical protein
MFLINKKVDTEAAMVAVMAAVMAAAMAVEHHMGELFILISFYFIF